MRKFLMIYETMQGDEVETRTRVFEARDMEEAEKIARDEVISGGTVRYGGPPVYRIGFLEFVEISSEPIPVNIVGMEAELKKEWEKEQEERLRKIEEEEDARKEKEAQETVDKLLKKFPNLKVRK